MGNILRKKEIAKTSLVLLASVICIIVLRLIFDQWQGYSVALKSLEANNRRSAIMYFDRVLNAHIPFSPLETKAKEKLIRIGNEFEKSNDLEQALLCYETVRTSRYLARHFWIPDKGDLPLLNDKIATIKARLLVTDGIVKDFKEGYDQQMGIMNKDFSPSVFWSVIAVASFGLYIGFVVLWIFKRKKIYMAAFGLCFIIWVVALYIA